MLREKPFSSSVSYTEPGPFLMECSILIRVSIVRIAGSIGPTGLIFSGSFQHATVEQADPPEVCLPGGPVDVSMLINNKY